MGAVMGRVSMPPLPFLPLPHLEVACPSKAECQTGAAGGGHAGQGRQQGGHSAEAGSAAAPR